MFESTIRALTCVTVLPRLLLLLEPAVALATFSLCRHLAKDRIAGQDYPSLTTLGDRDPERLVFGSGVTLMMLLQMSIMLLAWASLRARIEEAPHTTSHNGEGRLTMNMLVLGIGLGVAPFIILGAWIPHHMSSFNYVLSAVWFLGHALYQILFMFTRVLVFCLGPGLRHAHAGDLLKFFFFFSCFLTEAVTAGLWLSEDSHDNRLEYTFVGAIVLFNLGNWPEFGNLARLRSCLHADAIGYIQIA